MPKIDEDKEWPDKLIAELVIAICIVTLLFCGAVWFFKTYVDPPKITKIEFHISSTDSLRQRNYVSREDVDSLMRLINKYEAEIADKYQYMLEQEDNSDKYYSTFGVLLGIIFSLFGFFGYKSINAIEKQAIEKAEDKANHVAQETTDSILNRKIDFEIDKIFKQNYKQAIVKELSDEVVEKFTKKFNTVDSLSVRIKGTEEQLDKLTKEVHALETNRENVQQENSERTETNNNNLQEDKEANASEGDIQPEANPFDE